MYIVYLISMHIIVLVSDIENGEILHFLRPNFFIGVEWNPALDDIILGELMGDIDGVRLVAMGGYGELAIARGGHEGVHQVRGFGVQVGEEEGRRRYHWWRSCDGLPVGDFISICLH